MVSSITEHCQALTFPFHQITKLATQPNLIGFKCFTLQSKTTQKKMDLATSDESTSLVGLAPNLSETK
jgi:hypothetical protein